MGELKREVIEKGLHFAGSVSIVGVLGGSETFFQARNCFVGTAQFGEGLSGHLVGRNVIRVVLDEAGELGEGEVGVALGNMFHCEAVAGKGIRRVQLQNFVEGGDLVH